MSRPKQVVQHCRALSHSHAHPCMRRKWACGCDGVECCWDGCNTSLVFYLAARETLGSEHAKGIFVQIVCMGLASAFVLVFLSGFFHAEESVCTSVWTGVAIFLVHTVFTVAFTLPSCCARCVELMEVLSPSVVIDHGLCFSTFGCYFSWEDVRKGRARNALRKTMHHTHAIFVLFGLASIPPPSWAREY